MQLYVVVASAGRAEVCSELADWSQNLVTPDGASVTWLLSTPTEADAPPSLPPGWVALTGARGAAAQRNRALDAVPTEADYVFFFDDDTVPRQDFFAAVVAGFEAHTAWVAITANLARDGAAEKVEIGLAEASSELAASEYRGDTEFTKVSELYGCAFAVRWASLSLQRFEERFPLYSWLEDLDYARQAMLRGEMVKLNAAVAVHRGVSSGGRTQHLRLGYSQVANPALLVNKHTLPIGIALAKTLRPVVRNVIGSLVGSQTEFRRERLRGNWMAVSDLIGSRGKAHPERILDL
ncbi:MAG TPA: glycosyltransferase [Propionicimonas sp.]|nr:glycosyltransferase [Propionicimonas sp.]